MKTAATITLSCLALLLAAEAAADGRSISKVNTSVTAEAGQSYDEISTVNGSVRIGSGASANEAETVNGSIEIESDAKVGTASTVNGAIKLREGVVVSKEASTVNGAVTLEKRARVDGPVSTVNGAIKVDAGEVKGLVTTVSGDVALTDGARLLGGLHVKKPTGNWFGGNDKRVTVSICSTCVVEGELRFDRAVDLRVESGAKIGRVIGDDVKRL
jgi:DUF4097 and DUF4098 domain-containing protein YvlB